MVRWNVKFGVTPPVVEETKQPRWRPPRAARGRPYDRRRECPPRGCGAQVVHERHDHARGRRNPIFQTLHDEKWDPVGGLHPVILRRRAVCCSRGGGRCGPAFHLTKDLLCRCRIGDELLGRLETVGLGRVLTDQAWSALTISGSGAMSPTPANRMTLRTRSGRSAARHRATRLLKPWPSRCTGPEPSASMTAATSAARVCNVRPASRPALEPVPRGLTAIAQNPACAMRWPRSAKYEASSPPPGINTTASPVPSSRNSLLASPTSTSRFDGTNHLVWCRDAERHAQRPGSEQCEPPGPLERDVGQHDFTE